MGGLGFKTVPACCVGAFPILDEIKVIEPDTLDWRDKPIKSEERGRRKVSRSDAGTPERDEAAKAVFNKPRSECSGTHTRLVLAQGSTWRRSSCNS